MNCRAEEIQPSTSEHTCGAMPNRKSDAAGRILMGVASLLAFVAVAVSVAAVIDADEGVLILETWRAVGLGVFSGLFALLSYRPRHYAGVWELVILNKLILTLVALTHASGAKGAEEIVLYDGTLTGVLIAAYILCRGWQAWSTVRS